MMVSSSNFIGAFWLFWKYHFLTRFCSQQKREISGNWVREQQQQQLQRKSCNCLVTIKNSWNKIWTFNCCNKGNWKKVNKDNNVWHLWLERGKSHEFQTCNIADHVPNIKMAFIIIKFELLGCKISLLSFLEPRIITV